jgi:hypothetical protein
VWAGRWVGGLATAGFALATVVVDGVVVRARGDGERRCSRPDRPAYEAVARMRGSTAGGALLELPFINEGPHRCITTEAASMVASTIHWLPLVGGLFRLPAAHRGLLLRTVGALPASEALET